MAYYDALKVKWATLSGTTAEKLAAINALTVAGPNVDVAVSTVVGKLMLTGAYLPLAQFAQGANNADQTHDAALAAAKTLMALVAVPNAPAFAMSDAASFTAIKQMMDAILAQESAAAGSTGFTSAVHDALLSLCATTAPWWQAKGYTSPIGQGDLDAAELN